MTKKLKTIHHLFLLIALCAASLSVNAQSAQPALATINYELEHRPDTNDHDNVRKTKFRTYLTKEGSRHMNLTMAERAERVQEMIKSMGLGAGAVSGGSVNTTRVTMGPSGGGQEELFLYPSSKKLYQIDQLGQTNYMIEQDFPQISWEIGQATKEIGGFQVQEARGRFAGRDYTVWFAPELPFPYGPWKLHGLPGLILEAEDSSGDVRFTYQGFEKIEGDAMEVALPENAVKASPAQFARAKSALEQNPAAGLQGSVPAGGRVTESRQIVVTQDRDGNRRTISGDEATAELERRRLEQAQKNNNPLELPETKKKK